MNIVEYRAMKAEMEKESSKEEQPIVQESVQEQSTNTETTTEQTKSTETETKSTETKEEVKQTIPDKIEIDGKEVPIDELKNGYLRQQDYTKKTQEVSRQRKEVEEALKVYEHLKANPQIAQQLAQQGQLPETLNPTTRKIQELEAKIYDMMLEQEINTLQSKYSDFEVREVLQVAHDKGITNLEDAYKIVKASKPQSQEKPVDVEKLKEQIRAEVIKELESNKDTSSIISSNDKVTPIKTDAPKLTEAELRVARNMKMSPQEYAKWRNAK